MNPHYNEFSIVFVIKKNSFLCLLKYFHNNSVDVVGNPVGYQLVGSFGKGQLLCSLMVYKANFQFLHNQIVLESINFELANTKC